MATTITRMLKKLGYTTYQEYLDSKHWQEFKTRYRKSRRTKRCMVCKHWSVSLHHITYCRLGNERLSDVVPLCQTHHEEVHKMLSDRGLSVGQSRRMINMIRRKYKYRA